MSTQIKWNLFMWGVVGMQALNYMYHRDNDFVTVVLGYTIGMATANTIDVFIQYREDV